MKLSFKYERRVQQRAHRGDREVEESWELLRVTQKKRYIAYGSNFTFSRVVLNQNFKPDPTSHFADTLSESEMAQIFKVLFDNESIQSSR